jgi:hypothetical protein
MRDLARFLAALVTLPALTAWAALQRRAAAPCPEASPRRRTPCSHAYDVRVVENAEPQPLCTLDRPTCPRHIALRVDDIDEANEPCGEYVVMRAPEPAPRVEVAPVAVGDRFTHVGDADAYEVVLHECGWFKLRSGEWYRWATADDLSHPGGPWRRVADDAPPTPVTHGTAPRSMLEAGVDVLAGDVDDVWHLADGPNETACRHWGPNEGRTDRADRVTCPECRRVLAGDVEVSR